MSVLRYFLKFFFRKRNELKEKTQEIAGDTYAVLGEPTRHQKRKLFAHSDIDPHWPETSLRFSSQIKASHNNVLHGSYPNNKVSFVHAILMNKLCDE